MSNVEIQVHLTVDGDRYALYRDKNQILQIFDEDDRTWNPVEGIGTNEDIDCVFNWICEVTGLSQQSKYHRLLISNILAII